MSTIEPMTTTGAPAIVAPGWTETHQEPFRVLVVEDEDLMRSIIVQLLRREGYVVHEAKASAPALQIFEQEKIDLAILDQNLSGGGSGLEVLGKMHQVDPEVMG